MRATPVFAVIPSAIGLVLNPGPVPGHGAGSFALSFDGVDDFVVVPNSPVLELTSGTIELWFKADWAAGSLSYDPSSSPTNMALRSRAIACELIATLRV